MIKLIGFDLDGTILDSLPDLERAVNFALRRAALPERTLTEIRQSIGNGLLLLLERVVAPVKTPEVLTAVKADFDAYYGEHFCDESVLYPGIIDLLHAIKDQSVKVVIYSNKPVLFVKAIMTKLFPDYPFAAILGENPEYPKKPDVTQLKAIQNQFGFADEECVFIGDSDVDMQTAKNAHFTALAVAWGYRDRFVLEAAGAEFIAESTTDIMDWIQNM